MLWTQGPPSLAPDPRYSPPASLEIKEITEKPFNQYMPRSRRRGIRDLCGEYLGHDAPSPSRSGLFFAVTGENPAEVGQSVQVAQNLRIHLVQCGDPPFGATANCPRKVERGGRCAGSRDHPVFRVKRFVLLEVFNHRADAVDHFGANQTVSILCVPLQVFRRSGKLPHESNKIFLDGEDLLDNERIGGGCPNQTECTSKFVHTTAGFDLRISL